MLGLNPDETELPGHVRMCANNIPVRLLSCAAP